MGWNEPDDKNPWGGKSQPPDLDEVLKQLRAKFNKFFIKPKRGSSGSFGKLSASPSSTNGSGDRTFALLIGVVILVLWALSGIFIVDPAEEAAILRFGRYVRTVGAGPHWIPRLIESKITLNVDRVSDYSYSAQMLTQDENLVAVSVAVQYRIGDLEDYLFNVVDVEESLRQATSSALRQVVGTTTLDQLITEGRDAWGFSVHDSLVKNISSISNGDHHCQRFPAASTCTGKCTRCV